LGRVLADGFGDLVNVDSKIWRSVGTLVAQPGRLTRRYLDGQRARFTPPFRMYLVTSLVFFLIFSLERGADPAAPAATPAQTAAETNAAAPAPGVQAPTPERAGEGIQIILEGDQWSCNLFDRDLPLGLRERLVAACATIERDDTSFTRALVDNVPVMMLIFIPIMAVIMRVLYLFARRKYVEHLLFFAHVHTFFFLLGIALLLLSFLADLAPSLEWPARLVSYAISLYFPVYVFLAMRHVYRQGPALTAVKYVVLGGSYFVALLSTLLATIAVTAVTF
jgi:hypothetical protein